MTNEPCKIISVVLYTGGGVPTLWRVSFHAVVTCSKNLFFIFFRLTRTLLGVKTNGSCGFRFCCEKRFRARSSYIYIYIFDHDFTPYGHKIKTIYLRECPRVGRSLVGEPVLVPLYSWYAHTHTAQPRDRGNLYYIILLG